MSFNVPEIQASALTVRQIDSIVPGGEKVVVATPYVLDIVNFGDDLATVMSADHSLAIDVNDGDRRLSMGGDLAIGADFTTTNGAVTIQNDNASPITITAPPGGPATIILPTGGDGQLLSQDEIQNKINMAVQGLDAKESVKACLNNFSSTLNRTYIYSHSDGLGGRGRVTVTGMDAFSGGNFLIDNVILNVEDRILINASTPIGPHPYNGIWVVSSLNVPGEMVVLDRPVDFNKGSGDLVDPSILPNVSANAYVWVEEGAVHSDSGYVLITPDPIILDTGAGTALSFVQFTGAGQITPGVGIIKSGSVLSVKQGDGIAVGALGVSVDSSVVRCGAGHLPGANQRLAITDTGGCSIDDSSIVYTAGNLDLGSGSLTTTGDVTALNVTVNGDLTTNANVLHNVGVGETFKVVTGVDDNLTIDGAGNVTVAGPLSATGPVTMSNGLSMVGSAITNVQSIGLKYGAFTLSLLSSPSVSAEDYPLTFPPLQSDPNEFLVNDGTGALTWAPVLARHFQVTSHNIIINNTTAKEIVYFPWNSSLYGAGVSVTVNYWGESGTGSDASLDVLGATGVSGAGTTIVAMSSSTIRTFTFTSPMSDTLLKFTVVKLGGAGSDPQIFGITMEF